MKTGINVLDNHATLLIRSPITGFIQNIVYIFTCEMN